jgi:hypothetical protein
VKQLLIICLLLLWNLLALGQTEGLSNLRYKTMSLAELSTGDIDSLSVVASTFRLAWADSKVPVDTSWYRIDNKTFSWRIPVDSLLSQRPSENPRFLLSYRVYAFDWGAAYAHLDSAALMQQAMNGDYIGFDFSPFEPVDNLTDLNGINYSGSFSRGISFGNSQSLVLNSQFNLQLAGKIGNDIEILAAITDQNIPRFYPIKKRQ